MALVLAIVGVYLALGVGVGLYLALVGVNRIDPAAARGSVWFRVAVFPGLVALWPVMIGRVVAARGASKGDGS